jgi:hypothetical protein
MKIVFLRPELCLVPSTRLRHAWIISGTSGRFPQKRNKFFCFGRVVLKFKF